MILLCQSQRSPYIPKQVYTNAHCVHKFKTISVHNTKLVSEFSIILEKKFSFFKFVILFLTFVNFLTLFNFLKKNFICMFVYTTVRVFGYITLGHREYRKIFLSYNNFFPSFLSISFVSFKRLIPCYIISNNSFVQMAHNSLPKNNLIVPSFSLSNKKPIVLSHYTFSNFIT